MPDFKQIQDTFEGQYVIGDTVMDEVHEEFVVLGLLAQNAKGQAFADAFKRLFEHTQQHFADEEARMQATGYPAYGEHRADHQRILGDMDRFNQRIQAGRSAMARSWLNDSLPNWFDVHAKTMDSSLSAHLNQKLESA
ncbi:MAG: bacteriohemerythrin [Oceanobacter sp.]